MNALSRPCGAVREEGGWRPEVRRHGREQASGSAGGRTLATIQALRAVAALFVVAKHTTLGIGNFGVDIFFVISGFIISYVANRDARDFFVRRLFRIIPLYWLGTLVIAGAALVLPSSLHHPMRGLDDLLCSLLFIPYQSPNGFVQPVLFLGWTLNYEMFFYLLFAAALWIWRRHHVAVVLTMIGALVLLGAVCRFESTQLQFWTSPIMLEFCFGILLFEIWRRGRIPTMPAAALVIALIPMLALGVLEGHGVTGGRFLAFGIPAFLVVMLVLAAEGRFAVPALLLMIGDASYSLYLFHPYVVGAIYKAFASPSGDGLALELLLIVSAVALAVAVALLCYRFVERPGNVWLRAKYEAGAGSRGHPPEPAVAAADARRTRSGDRRTFAARMAIRDRGGSTLQAGP